MAREYGFTDSIKGLIADAKDFSCKEFLEKWKDAIETDDLDSLKEFLVRFKISNRRNPEAGNKLGVASQILAVIERQEYESEKEDIKEELETAISEMPDQGVSLT